MVAQKQVASEEEVTQEAEQEQNTGAFERLKAAGVPDEVIKQIPAMKARFKEIQVAYLGSGAYIYRKLSWSDMKAITNSLANLASGPNAKEHTLRMTDLELQLEKAVLYPSITPMNAGQYPSGDLEALQALINEFSGYAQMPPQTEEL